jgi:hypothetical protein
MSMSKLNVFHWHVVDSQSFPLEIPGFLELARKGAYSSQDIYTTADVQDIVKYAAEVCVVLCNACRCWLLMAWSVWQRGIDVLMVRDLSEALIS